MAHTQIEEIYRRMLRDEQFYQQLMQAGSPEESQRLLLEAGFDIDVSFGDAVADLRELGAKGSSVAEEELGTATERAVDWVGAIATAGGVVVGAIAIT
jgi:hypothetical protein